MTSTLQQEAGRKLRFSAQRAMQVAQRLYEQGWITYMRTDSTTLSDEALDRGARARPREMYGADYVPDAPRRYERKVKNAQEAHEAIRPAGETFRTPEQAGRDAVRRRAPPLRADLEAHGGLPDDRRHRAPAPRSAWRRRCRRRPAATAGASAEFSASGRVIAFPGFLPRLRRGRRTTPTPSWPTARSSCPRWPRATWSRAARFEPGSHTTQPPARYTEASLVKAMEELGVGRPSHLRQRDRHHPGPRLRLEEGHGAGARASPPSPWSGLLERYFAELVDYGFTASMEDDLDEIAAGREEALPWLTRFYFGDRDARGRRPAGDARASARAQGRRGHPPGRHRRPGDQLHPASERGATAQQIVARVGRYGPYLQRGDDRASLPDDMAPDELTVERAEELLAAPSNDRVLGTDPETRARRAGQGRALRPLRPAGRGGRGRGQAAHLVAVLHHGPGHARPWTQALELLRIPRVGGHRPRHRRGGRGPQRQVRPLPQARHRHPQPDQRGPAPHRHAAEAAGALRPAQAAARAGPPRHRSASSGADPDDRTCPWSSRRGASGPT